MKILVLEALGLHLGYVGCYGNEWVATPNLDRIAAEGIVFEWHIANEPELLPTTPFANRSVASGCYAREAVVGATMLPRVERCMKVRDFADEVLKLLEAKDAWLWIEGPSLLPPWPWASDLIDVYFDEDDIEDGLTPWSDPPLDVLTLNEADVLRLQNSYGAVVTLFDAQLGAVLDNLDDDTLLCMTARSGLPLGEHGMIGAARPALHDELVHVPLLMRLPRREWNSTRVAALTQPIDLLPTFLEALAQAAPPVHGRSLWPLIRGEVDTIRPFAFASLQLAGELSRLFRSPNWALHVNSAGTPQLFVKPDDRWEVNDLYQQQIETAEPMEAELRDFTDKVIRPGPLAEAK